MRIPKPDIIALTALLSDFEKLCIERNIKFNKYSPDQLYDFLMLYRSYKQYPPETAPF